MSNHIISGKDSTNNKVHPIKATSGDLHIKLDSANTTQLTNINSKLGDLYLQRDLQNGTIFNNQTIGAGGSQMSSVFTQESNSDFVFYGEDTTSSNGLIKIFISDTETGTYYETLELLSSVSGSIYGRFPIYTKFFKISFTNTSSQSTNITLKFSSKN